MPYYLSQSQIDEILALRAIAIASGETTLGAWAPVYSRLAEMITAPNGGPVEGVDHNVWLWLQGAQWINSGQGVFADIIRNYTANQYTLRYGSEMSQDDLTRASNSIASAFIDDVLANGVPNIADTGLIDAGPVAAGLFEGNYSPWAGTVFFAPLNHDQFFRDWVLTLDSTEFKKEKGTYDLIAAAQSIQDIASLWIVTSPSLWANFFQTYSVSAIKDYTNDWFKQTYGITENFTVGSDIFGWTALAINWLKSTHYAVGTYSNDIISTVPSASGSYVNNATLELIGGSVNVRATSSIVTWRGGETNTL